jgi:hypothetical protein
MAKRLCYVHVGPHKTGTKSIQWFLKEHRAELLKQGYFVPESGNIHGGHHAIVRGLCGQELPAHQQSAAAEFAHALEETPCERVVISSEALHGLFQKRECAKEFFSRTGELNLVPKLISFPRNQSQLTNSRYAEVVKSFRRSEPFEAFVQGVTGCPSLRYSLLIELADAFDVKLVACPFTGETITHGVVPEFLRAMGLDPSQFRDTNARRNRAAGPFTVSVARSLLRLSRNPNKQLKWLQAERCKKKLAAYLKQQGWADTGYCGLTTALARNIEKEWRPDNDTFAQRVWGRQWAEIFTADIGREFTPNDLEISEPDESTEQRLREAVREMTPTVEEIMVDRTLAVDAAWNDLRQRAGQTPKAHV